MGTNDDDRFEIKPVPESFRPRRVKEEMLAPLRGKLKNGLGTFDIHQLREEPHDPSLRD